ncbi:MerR family transcriptional regulator [Rhodococcus pyridinivorans]|uniref:MerR family transcriptional regulator n=1 Tax=Rhodococcus pyridinivorans TaxID=103816 RepID=UPI0036A598BC
MTTGRLAAATGYSVQQVRDLERLGVIPSAVRMPNSYRRFGPEHVTALRAYRALAVAVGPVEARRVMHDVQVLPYDEALARVVELHSGLARARAESLTALRALDTIVDEAAHDAPPLPGDAMSITALANAIGVRSSTLRFWEKEGLVAPERIDRNAARSYSPAAARDARIVAALRAGGYSIPAVRAVMAAIGTDNDTDTARDALHERLHTIAVQSEMLLRAGADIANLIENRTPRSSNSNPKSATATAHSSPSPRAGTADDS